MIRTAITLLVLLMVGGTAAVLLLRNRAKASDTDRVVVAREHCEAALRKLCAEASLPYPPREIFLRVLKQDQRLEVWARETDPFALLKSYPFTAFCGELGPKRREGDRQIPEGLYVIDRFNPLSLFHLSLRVNYPNASDRVLSDPDRPGFDIYIHGSNQTVGCIPLGDEAIEALYVLAIDTVARGQKEIPIHIFPAAMNSPGWEEYQAQHPEKVTSFGPFWENLAQAYRAFEETRLVPVFEVDSTGRYQMKREPIVAR